MGEGVCVKAIDRAAVFRPHRVVSGAGMGAQVYLDQNVQGDEVWIVRDDDRFRVDVIWWGSFDPALVYSVHAFEGLKGGLGTPMAAAARCS